MSGPAATGGERAVEREDVSFYSEGTRINGWFHDASRRGVPAPAVVLCPGFTGNKFGAFYRPFVETLIAAGTSVLLFDYRGWGDSEGERGAIYPLGQVADVRNCLTYLETRPEVDAQRMGLLGMSFGGAHAVYAAAVDKRVAFVIALSPVADGRTWLRHMRRAYEWEQYLELLAVDRRTRVLKGEGARVDPAQQIMLASPERSVVGARVKGDVPASTLVTDTPLACADAMIEYRPIEVAHRISPRPLLVLYVEHDSVVPAEDHSVAVYEAAREPKRIVRLPPSSHYAAYVECFPEIRREMLAWGAAHGVLGTGVGGTNREP